jgi:ATP-dependent RNA helicase SUPV3L1/SUV3
MSRFSRSPLTAVLGPTNTGKTHLAVERMLGHSSGVMGFPLRLLAREVYDRVVAAKGVGAAALVTGEERIWPETARYLLATVEAMPLLGDGAKDSAFVAIDEAQLGQDRERGHVFTSRLLHARGREETMILGSAALSPVVRGLLPEAEIIARPRFSTLSYDGPKKLSRLPPRTAIVAFSAEEVYAIAEALRRFSGGAAVVMGALSPRTRNAQVAMFQAGEVDYLVATDAIGMGLNLDVGHVAFASLNKFDGQRQRRLTVAEMAQIAGRAGRHQRDGSFGSVGAEAMFAPEEIEAIEQHHFPPLDWLYWRNPAPATGSVAELIAGLEAAPDDPMLRPAPESTDLAVLRRMQGDAEAMALVAGEDSVRRLWSACSLPDFAKAGVEAHGRLVARIWRDLATGNGHVDAEWFARGLAALDVTEGSVEALADRVARVRSYCYIAHRADWLADPAAMAEQARDVETRLSDALHGALTARFVDRRTAVLLRAIGQDAASLPVRVAEDGSVLVDNEPIGRLEGFHFRVDPTARADDHRMMLAAAEKHLAVELTARATALASAADDELELRLAADALPTLLWRGLPVATLKRGRNRLAPRIAPERSLAALDAHLVAAVVARLDAFVDAHVGDQLGPLVAMAQRARDADAAPEVRAVLAAMVEGGGVADREAVDASLAAMQPPHRDELRRLGVRVGTLDLFHPQLLKPKALSWLAALDGAWREAAVPPTPAPGIALVAATPGDASPALGAFRRVRDWWLRVDMIERVALHAHTARRKALETPAVAPKRGANAARAAAPVVEAALPEAAEPHAPAEAPTADAAPVEAAPVTLPDNATAAGDAPEAPASIAAAEPAPATDAAATPASNDAAPAEPSADAAAPPAVAMEPGSFTIGVDLARSIGLPLADRLALYGLLGFRTRVALASITPEGEADVAWTWRGRRKERPRGDHRQRGAPRRDHGGERAQHGEDRPRHPRSNEGDRPRGGEGKRRGDEQQRDARGKGGFKPGGFKGKPPRDRGRDDRRDDRGDRAQQQRPPRRHEPINNPFGALAGLFGPKDE